MIGRNDKVAQVTAEDIFFLSAFILAGWLRVRVFVIGLGLLLLGSYTFVKAHQPSGPFGLYSPNLEVSILTSVTIALVHFAAYGLAHWASATRGKSGRRTRD